MMSKYDIVCIGDTAIDAFIRLNEASVQCDINKKNCQLCLSYADKIPYESLDIVAGAANASNVSVGSARLGLKTAMLTAIGDDDFGKQVLEVYKKEQVATEFVKINKSRLTNYHFVLNYQAERTILVKHNLYDYYNPEKIRQVPWIYFSALAENSLPFHNQLADFLELHSDIKMGFTPNTFQLKLGKKKLKRIYKNTYVLLVNREEAQRILEVDNPDVKILFRDLHKLGPKLVVITDGPKGAYASDGHHEYFMPIYPDPAPPFERTGCGDAFASAFMAGLVHNLSFVEILRQAPINSMSVVQYTGAQKGLLTTKQIEGFLKKAPKNYYPKNI